MLKNIFFPVSEEFYVHSSGDNHMPVGAVDKK